jgi:hypothetical protein
VTRRRVHLAIQALALGAALGPARAADVARSDLSVCQSGGDTRVARPAPVSVAEFAARLNGTWQLKPRTIQGAIIDADARFYFDIEKVGAAEATGKALLIDRGNLSQLDPLSLCRACLEDVALGALWDVTIKAGTDSRFSIALRMDGEYRGSYGDFEKGMNATEEALFYKEGDVYLGGKLSSPAGGSGFPDDVWDRVGLTDRVLTYVSCRGRFVDRYVKLSDATPRLEGRPLKQAWDRIKASGSFTSPPHVERPLDEP